MTQQSKERFTAYADDFQIHDSLDSASRMFVGLPDSPPSLERALSDAGIEGIASILEDSREFANIARSSPEISILGLTDDEAGAIACYTLQGTQGAKSPYEVINEGLAGSGGRTSLYPSRKLIYLFLSGLRKLPRFRLAPGQMLYRGISTKVPTSEAEAKGHQFYEEGKIVTWWGFTSTTTDLGVTNKFISAAAASTLFNIGGKDLWGYDIQPFSPFEEKEILLEPETKVVVGGIASFGASLVVHVELQPFARLVLEDIIPSREQELASAELVETIRQSSSAKVPIPLQQRSKYPKDPKLYQQIGCEQQQQLTQQEQEQPQFIQQEQCAQEQPQPQVPSQGPPPEVPEGWETRYDSKSDKYYYADLVDEITTWDKPPCVPNLPSGWRVAYDQQKGSFVYKSTKTGKIRAEVPMPGAEWECGWKECPEGVAADMRYVVNTNGSRAVMKVGSGSWSSYCTVVGDAVLPQNTVVSWSIRVLKAKENYSFIFVGVAPSDVSQSEEENYAKCGWYLDCYDLRLYSGPPHSYSYEKYALNYKCGSSNDENRKGGEGCVRTGDIIGVVMDTTKGELSFTLNKVSFGVAYEGIPLDKPLVPCVLLFWVYDTIELIV